MLHALFAESARREIEQHFMVDIRRLGILLLAAEAFGFVKARFLGNLRRVLGVVGDGVEDLLGGSVVALAIQVLGAGQFRGRLA